MRLSFALLVGAAAGLLAATQPIADTDLFWHLATGRETLAHGLVRADVFSWTVRGAPVSLDQWLGQVLLYGAYLALDWRGVAVLRIASVTALMTLVVLAAMPRAAGRPLAAVIAAMPALVLTRAVWVDRPELFGLVCFAALLVLLRDGRNGTRDGRSERLWAVVPLIVVWSNLHGSFALGAVLAVIACAEGAWRDAARRRTYLATAVASVAATLCTPSGLGAWTAPGSHFLAPPRDIQEWALIDIRTPLGVAYTVTLALVLLCALRGPRLTARELAVLLPVAFLSLTAARQAPLLAIAAAPLFADRISALIARRVAPPRAGPSLALAWTPVAALLAAAIVIAPAAPDESGYPTAALTSIPKGDGLLARYEWGGWLIWRAPATPVFVDGRLTPYRGAVLDDYHAVTSAAPGWEEVIARRGVRALLVRPDDAVATRAVDRGWRVLARGNGFVVIAVP